jgi:hypothetical protein
MHKNFAGCRVSQGPVPSTSLDVLFNCHENNIIYAKVVQVKICNRLLTKVALSIRIATGDGAIETK